MRSRRTTYLLLAAVIAVWGVVAWKILAPASDLPSGAPAARTPAAAATPAADTLWLDYPDPFLKGGNSKRKAAAPAAPVRSLPPRKTAPVRREQVKIMHLGTVVAGKRQLYILSVGDQQYEVARGDSLAGFLFAAYDRDSLYLRKAGITYGVALCR